MFEIVCPDKGIEGSTSLNLWDGGTISIREIIDRRLQARLVGADDRGQIIPTDVTGWAKAKSKVTWISIQVTSRISPRASTSRHPTVLRVTADQEILVDGEIQKAKDVRPGGTVLSSHHEPGPSVLHLMRSGLLGDACVVPGKVSRSAWFRGAHKETHRAYSEAIHRWLGPCATALTESGGMVAVQSRNYAALHDLRAQWYPDGVKQVPRDLSWIDDFTIAKWYMDDGTLVRPRRGRSSARFATNGFSQDDIRRLGCKLRDLYGISFSVSAVGELNVSPGLPARGNDIRVMWSAIATSPDTGDAVQAASRVPCRPVHRLPGRRGEADPAPCARARRHSTQPKSCRLSVRMVQNWPSHYDHDR